MDNFKRTIIFQATSDNKVFDALTNSITKWWTEILKASQSNKDKLLQFVLGQMFSKQWQLKN